MQRELLFRLSAAQPSHPQRAPEVDEAVVIELRCIDVNAVVPATRMRQVEVWLEVEEPLDTLLRVDLAASPPRPFGGSPHVHTGEQMSRQRVSVVKPSRRLAVTVEVRVRLRRRFPSPHHAPRLRPALRGDEWHYAVSSSSA